MNEEFMAEAIRLSLEKMRQGQGGPFGAVIVKEGEIIARGSNLVTSTNDPTAHAEIVAIREACRRLGTFTLAGCELFTSCEPCPMCLGAIYWARMERVFYAATRHDAAEAGFDDEFLYREMAAAPAGRKLPLEPLLREPARAAFAEWMAKADKIRY